MKHFIDIKDISKKEIIPFTIFLKNERIMNELKTKSKKIR